MPALTGSRSLALSALALLASACASTFTPSPAMRSLQASLDKPQAARIFAGALARSPAATGLCGAPFTWDDPRPAATGETYSIQAFRAGEELGRATENGRAVIRYRKVAYVEERRFSELKKIRVTREAAGMCKMPVQRGQVALTFHDGRIEGPIVVAVAPRDLDAVVAALTILAPQAVLVEGAGL
jgi:hypothetical protein